MRRPTKSKSATKQSTKLLILAAITLLGTLTVLGMATRSRGNANQTVATTTNANINKQDVNNNNNNAYIPIKEHPAEQEPATNIPATTTTTTTTTGDDDDDDDDNNNNNNNNGNINKPEEAAATTTTTTTTTADPFFIDVPTNKGENASPEDLENERRLEAVKAAMKHAWGGYVKYAWGSDEVRPVSKTGQNWLGMGGTIIDSLDTLWIMGLTEDFNKARDWVRDQFDPGVGLEVSFFETTIRVVGGLLSAYALSGDRMFVDKAAVLGKNLLKAVDERSGVPYSMVHLTQGHKKNHGWCQGKSILADIGTIQLEYTYLSALTGDMSYAEKALRVLDILFDKNKDLKGKLTAYVDPASGRCAGGAFSLNGLTDSYFEYLVKLWVFLGGYDSTMAKKYRDHYDEATDSIRSYLVHITPQNKLTILGGYERGMKSQRMEHLACFAGGMFALGATAHNTSKTPNHDSAAHLELAKDITHTCYEMYHRTPTHVGPETIRGLSSGPDDYYVEARHSILRPEAVESIFYLWRTTHDKKYRDWGWEMFQGIEKYCKAEGGYSGIQDVYNTETGKDDSQPTWFLAETLKYLYLLFAPDNVIPLDKYVFNTEAHPFLILGPSFSL